MSMCTLLRQLAKPIIECVRPPRCSTDGAVEGFVVSGTIDIYRRTHAAKGPQNPSGVTGCSNGAALHFVAITHPSVISAFNPNIKYELPRGFFHPPLSQQNEL